MTRKIIELENFSPVPHAKHLLPVKTENNTIKIHLIDKCFNNQGGMELTLENTKQLISELKKLIK